MTLNDIINGNCFAVTGRRIPSESLPCPDEPCALDWARYIGARGDMSPESFLSGIFVQLLFPVEAGQSAREEYLAATRRGELPETACPLHFEAPEQIHIYMHQTPVGRLPVIETGSTADFAYLLRAVAYRNEPRELPDSMGAAFVKGYNDWRRIREHIASGMSYAEATAQKELYQDVFLLLSGKYYSGISPELAGIAPEEFRRLSLLIRRGHEISHYMTKRFFLAANNHIHDEIIADYMGLTEALGHYDARLFLAFVGLESPGRFREGGRLANYLSGAELAPGEFETLCDTVRAAAANIERLDSSRVQEGGETLRVFETLCHTTVAEMARGEFFCGWES